jgi:uncharacterized protein (TIGR04141 family)
MYAVPFGLGRYLLSPEVIERDFGARCAVSVILPLADTGTQSRIRSMDVKQLAANSMRSRRQSTFPAGLDEFGVERSSNLVTGFTGTPADVTAWGPTISGSDSVKLYGQLDLDGLGKRIEALEDLSHTPDFAQAQADISLYAVIKDPVKLDHLEDAVVADVAKASPTFDLGVPEIHDFSPGTTYRFSGLGSVDERDTSTLSVAALKAALNAAGIPTNEWRDRFKKMRVTRMVNKIDDGSWTLARCLVGSITEGDHVLVIDDGVWYRVPATLMAEINAHLSKILEAPFRLPDAYVAEEEGDYNKRVSADPRYLLMDRKNVQVGARQKFEFCDLLVEDAGILNAIAVKRDFASSDLSHLIRQGLTSMTSLTDTTLRAKIRDAIDKVASKPPWTTNVDPYITADTVAKDRVRLVYGIIGDWRGGTLVQRLPFFSKLTLHEAFGTLERLGMNNVAYAKISMATGAPPAAAP